MKQVLEYELLIEFLFDDYLFHFKLIYFSKIVPCFVLEYPIKNNVLNKYVYYNLILSLKAMQTRSATKGHLGSKSTILTQGTKEFTHISNPKIYH